MFSLLGLDEDARCLSVAQLLGEKAGAIRPADQTIKTAVDRLVNIEITPDSSNLLDIIINFSKEIVHQVNYCTSNIMVTINCAYSEPINPAGSSPALTKDQVWKGLQIKTRHPQAFVPIISGCDILEDKDDVVIRKADFIDRPSIAAHSVVETCKSYYPTVS